MSIASIAQELADGLESWGIDQPSIAVVLGTGMGTDEAIENVLDEQSYYIDTADIKGWPNSTVAGHAGRLIFGKIGGEGAVLLKGRVHYYEGYSMRKVTKPIRILNALGVEKLLLTNASGSVNPDLQVGRVVIIDDHINMQPSPLIGPNIGTGPRFLDVGEVYDKKTVAIAKELYGLHFSGSIYNKTGTYLALTGPTYETPAEYKMVKILGADLVGMSTVPEAIVGRHCGMKVFAASIVTDSMHQDSISHEEVQEKANLVAPKLASFLNDVARKM